MSHFNLKNKNYENLIKFVFAVLFIASFAACEKGQIEIANQTPVVSEEILPETPIIEALWISEVVHPNGNARIYCKVPGMNCKRGGGEVSRTIRTTNFLDETPELVIVEVTYEEDPDLTDTLFIEQ